MRRSTGSLSSFLAGRLAPATPKPTGTPWPSVSRLRLPPLLARSGGWGPGFFPPKRGLRHRPVPAQPAPVEAFQLITLFPPCLPQLPEYPRRHPFLQPGMGGGMGTQVRGLPGSPLTARAQDGEEGVGTRPSRYPGAPATQALGVLVPRHSGREHGPQGVRDAIAARHGIPRCPRPGSWLSCCCAQGTQGIIT